MRVDTFSSRSFLRPAPATDPEWPVCRRYPAKVDQAVPVHRRYRRPLAGHGQEQGGAHTFLAGGVFSVSR